MNTCTYCGNEFECSLDKVIYKHRYVGNDLNMKHFLLSFVECPECNKLINIDSQQVK